MEIDQLMIVVWKKIVWAGEYADEIEGEKGNWNSKAREIKVVGRSSSSKYPYLINHTKKEFIDKEKSFDCKGWRIHPLPLMVCD